MPDQPYEPVPVTVAPDGSVIVGDEPDTDDFTALVLDVAGGSLTWPLLTDRPPTAWLSDPATAADWLWSLYGEAVAVAVDGTTRDGVTRTVTAVRTPASALARRLAWGHWASRWWPASTIDGIPALPSDVLGLELVALTHRNQSILDPEVAADDITDLLRVHEPAVETLVTWWRADRGPVGHTVAALLRTLVHAADAEGVDSPALDAAAEALDGAPAPAAMPNFARPGDFALAAGDSTATGRVIASGFGVNDWRRYPPGLVDAAEDAVSWTARASGAARRIDVDVAAGELAEPTARLAAEVVLNGDTQTRIRLRPGDGAWRGGTELAGPVTTATRFDVGVLLPGFDQGELPDARDRRDAVRAHARARLAAATTGARTDEPFLAELIAAATESI
ncbi:hypothetical protein [Stackebrandtia soli]|uniref:hypothetical protein n=1 Tax=Stackebrandtia soli TaxID=1892856 RepID=UPI0039E78CFF